MVWKSLCSEKLSAEFPLGRIHWCYIYGNQSVLLWKSCFKLLKSRAWLLAERYLHDILFPFIGQESVEVLEHCTLHSSLWELSAAPKCSHNHSRASGWPTNVGKVEKTKRRICPHYWSKCFQVELIWFRGRVTGWQKDKWSRRRQTLAIMCTVIFFYLLTWGITTICSSRTDQNVRPLLIGKHSS